MALTEEQESWPAFNLEWQGPPGDRQNHNMQTTVRGAIEQYGIVVASWGGTGFAREAQDAFSDNGYEFRVPGENNAQEILAFLQSEFQREFRLTPVERE